MNSDMLKTPRQATTSVNAIKFFPMGKFVEHKAGIKGVDCK
jgi:hypothetical protein